MKEKRIRKRFINSELENTINCDVSRKEITWQNNVYAHVKDHVKMPQQNLDLL